LGVEPIKMQKAKIKLIGRDKDKIDDISSQIIDIAKKADVEVSGIIRLPTKKLKVTTRKSPDGEGSATFERWEMRIHKRLVMVAADEKALRRVMRIQIPKDVHVEIRL
jgi:small subunit ribosomal protein S10